MSDHQNKLRHWFEYYSFQIFLRLLRLMPLKFGNWLGRRLGALAFRVLKSRRQLTLENLIEAQRRGFFPSTLDMKRVARQTWEHLGMMGSEFVYYSNRPQMVMKNIVIEGEESLRQVLEQKRGLIFATVHLGNWEIMGMRMALAGYKVSSISKTQSNGLFDDYINQSRMAAGIKLIPKLSFLRPVIRAFQQNEIVSFFIDQNAGKRGVPLEIFGRLTRIPQGAAEFAMKTNTPVVFVYIVREAGDRHRIVISEELKLIQSGNYEADLAANTKQFMERIQTVIQQYPEQWLWMHKLWQTGIRLSK